jgi:cardiolipin synthase
MSRKEAPVEKTGNQSAERWIEVVHPLADVMKMLAALIEQSPADLTGASIAVAESECLDAVCARAATIIRPDDQEFHVARFESRSLFAGVGRRREVAEAGNRCVVPAARRHLQRPQPNCTDAPDSGMSYRRSRRATDRTSLATRVSEKKKSAVGSWFKRHGGRAMLVVACATLLATLIGLNFAPPEKEIEIAPKRLYGVGDPQFKRALGNLLGPPITGGNRIDTLRNGDEIFPAMLAAIRAAKHNIDFETYVYWSGQIGRDFADAIAERVRAGVSAHILLDWVGSQRMEKSTLQTMLDAGARVEFYHPLRWYTIARMNNRTHRKLLVVDGRIGFTGGVGIAQEWTGHAQDPEHWRDTHFRVEGPAVAQMQSAFLDNWMTVTGEVMHGEDYFPPLADAARSDAQMFESSPTGGSESMELMYLLTITAADRSIVLAAAYFIPDELTSRALVEARRRGVDIRVIVPGPYNDAKVTRFASRATWGPLLAAGVRIFEYQPTMFHCKVLVVDGLLTSVGSTNFDDRSFRLNDEASLNVYDAGVAAEQTRIFEDDLKRSREYTIEDWKTRSWRQRLSEWLSSVVASQL